MPPENQPEVKASEVAAQARKATNQAAMALELPFVIVGTIALGAAIGYFLDRSFHTKPVLMFIFGALGFAGGVREIIRRLPG